ncbi:hypothetical protein HGO38_08465 [Rhizobium sp. CG5]|uniref:hypothetical protein n=1 Tax=Rhizobium sp. CG5 TaxID=2726076 RepID=UPI00203439AE|nr:hypothetical protein [Rhizobium sp. CG5]MCM2473510.1 hypothetical protein [Rhizobium sp. CG5]
MTQLSIFMPSNRSFKASRSAIESALRYAEKADCRFILSDNSGDPEKRRQFEHCSARMTYVVPPNDDALLNHMTALAQVETPFLMPMGDDDEIYLLDGEPRTDLAELAPDVIALRPRTHIWTVEKGVLQTERFAILSADAGDRLLEYNDKTQGNNSIYYSLYRTEPFRDLSRLFVDHHPTRGGYCDWSLSFALIASGRVLYDPATLYRYDLGRWAKGQSLTDTKALLYRQVGLRDEAEHYAALLRYIDVDCFLEANFLPLTPAMRQSAKAMNARIALGTFLRKVMAEPQRYDADVPGIAEAIGRTTDLSAVFAQCLPLVDRLSPGLGDRYVRFRRAASN